MTILDAVLLVIMLISAILAMVRGFSREILSIVSWVVAAGVALMFYEPVALALKALFPQLPDTELVQKGIAAAVIFIVVLIIMSYLTMLLADKIIDSRIGVLDRTAGFIFGAARGFLLVTITLMGFLWLAGDSEPAWVANAKSKEPMIQVGEAIRDALPANLEGEIKKYFNKSGNNNNEGEQDSDQKS